MHASFVRLSALPLVACLALACEKKQEQTEQGAAPPPIESSKPGACAGGGGKIDDPVSKAFFPRTAGSYCVDPNGETRAYGKDAGGTLDKVCTEQFDGECEVYKSYGLERVVTLRYIDGEGSSGSTNVNLSTFDSPEGAYGFFTKRVIADSDPLENAPKALDAGAAGAIGTGVAYVWKGKFVAELSYVNELESPEQLGASSAKVLPPIAQSLGKNLPGSDEMLPSVQALPEAERVPMGIRFVKEDVLGIGGLGSGAEGFYQAGKKRYRVLSLLRPDEAGAKDVTKTLKKVEGAKVVKNITFDALSFDVRTMEDGPKLGWVAGRRGNTVFCVGDEEYVATGGQDAADSLLSREEKLDKLKALIESPAPAKKESAGAE